ncbi:MAG TPA: hypothetical protein VFQ16_00155 [Burkholderiaceae bacterium]|nr:hypothetical protein [Burkholderiaceae bacterium]
MSERADAAPRRPAWRRLPLLFLGFVALFAGAGAGLARLGWPMPDLASGAAALHGPLMVCGFFGVVISLERAVAIGSAWAYAAPLAAGLGSAALVHGATGWGAASYLAASAGLLAASLRVLWRQREGFTLVMALGAACWCAGTTLWALGAPVHRVVGWWIGFLVLTIAGERLELSRFLPPSTRARRVFALVVAALLAALAAWPLDGAPHAFGLALFALAGWLLRQDIARRTIRQQGLTRFIAACLLSGYFWLAAGGAAIAWHGLAPGTPAYDAALHALLLGFVFSMVFGHAPIIFPAVLRVAVPYRPRFYVPLALLHAALLLRLAGDATGSFAATRWGALGTALALLVFIANMLVTVVGARRARPAPAGSSRARSPAGSRD